jgi:hypothetical protein
MNKIKKAVLLTASWGKPRRELTAELPVLEGIITGLRDAGSEEFLVIVGYRKEMVTGSMIYDGSVNSQAEPKR